MAGIIHNKEAVRIVMFVNKVREVFVDLSLSRRSRILVQDLSNDFVVKDFVE
jgi:hypothetical protein